MVQKTKTLQEARKELGRALDRVHKAKVDFMRAYEENFNKHWCSRIRPDDDEYFQSKFGEKTVIWDHTQE